MKKILFSLSCLCFLFACGEMAQGEYGPYPKEYKEQQLPAYPNVAVVGKSEASPLGDEGDIQINVKFKTVDGINSVRKFYNSKMKEIGFQQKSNNQLEQFQEQGVPLTDDTFYSGKFQNVGKVFNVTAIERNDTVNVNLTFMGS